MKESDNLRVQAIDPLIQPLLLKQEVPLSEKSQETVFKGREEAVKAIKGDGRVLVVVGPCSIHNPDQALEYAKRLQELVPELPNLVIVMRAYFEKPRTTTGWKGLINDPNLDGSFMINKGLRISRKVLCDITELGLPVGCELLDTISPQFLSDTISWGAIGARTTESQLHRELASGVSFPIGFKNGTDGSLGIAVDAMRASNHPHCFLGVTSQGLAGIVKTTGNPDLHVILRGGSSGTNYDKESVAKAAAAIKKARPEETPSLMVDCSHGNSQKDHRNQPKVLASVCAQLEEGDTYITGVMIESHINEGKQNIPEDLKDLKYGVSVTDACVSWEATIDMLKSLDKAAGVRRNLLQKKTNGVH
ncbi:phospho-2-dehydro-3-deoxyheptonate aldolase, tyrosine-inhibited [Atractiella rhizophila]|nr:phospho-2-dehydro-3-deoxyheptonate aldolase, tyrosine-inhibited [Atractiella rhizophila]